MNDHVDKFIETMLGKDESRIKLLSKHTELYDFSNTFSFKERIYEYREFLLSMSNCLTKNSHSSFDNTFGMK